jgi:DNA polymerase-1
MSNLYLIDGHSYLYRAFHALPYLSNSKGLPTNAVYGFTTMLSKLIREKQPDFIAVAFDSEKPTHRHETYEAYKAHRPQMPDPLVVQIPYVRRIVDAFRISTLIQDGVEADDLIGTVAKKAEVAGMDVVIVSGDKDMFQLVSTSIQVYDSMREKVYGEKEVRERLGVEPRQVVEVMALMGDAVDNIPGVPGVGEKTAVELIRQFGSIDHLLGNLDAVKKPKLREALKEFSEQLRMSRELARLHLDVPWDGDLDRLKRVDPDTQALIQLYTQLEFSTLRKGLLLGTEEAPSVQSQNVARVQTETPADPGRPLTREFIRMALEVGTVGMMAVPARTGHSLADAAISGVAFSCGPGKSLFTTIHGESESLIKEILEDIRIKKVGHGLKTLVRAVIPMGIQLRGLDFDTMLASYLLSSSRRTHDLMDLSVEYLGRPIQDLGTVENACQAAEAVLEISRVMKSKLEERGQSHLYQEVELPLIEVLSHMEYNGFKIDTELLSTVSKELDLQLQGLIERIYRLADGEFNLNSPKQLSEVLFDRLGLKPVKKTKTGYSTDEGVLSQLAQIHELPAEILNYRQLAKLKSTYVDALPQMVHPRTGRLHTTFHQTVAATGRLSSSDPNLQNIPIRGEWGRRIRQAFVAGEGCRLLSSDYNQIELRILAHLSQDEQLIKAFQEEKDVHTETASSLFKLPPRLISAEMRRAAKTVNFGVIYGMGPYALSGELGISQAEAKQYIQNYFEYYAGIKRFVESTIQEAQRRGYVTTLFNRRREIPEMAAQNATTRNLGERIAVNTLIQGSAADLMKLAMVRTFQELKRADFQSKMILQVHDELIFEMPEGEVETLKALVKQQMEGAVSLSVPIRVDLGVGRNWAEIH